MKPFGLFRLQDIWRQQFLQFVDCMTHIVFLLEGVSIDTCPARIANIVLTLSDLFKICRQLTEALEYVDLKG